MVSQELLYKQPDVFKRFVVVDNNKTFGLHNMDTIATEDIFSLTSVEGDVAATKTGMVVPNEHTSKPIIKTADELLLEKIYHPGSLSTRLLNSYIERVEILINALTESFKRITDSSQRELLAKKMREASNTKTEILQIKNSIPSTLEMLALEIKKCNPRESIDINDVYNRESTLCKSGGANDTFDAHALAKEYLRVKGVSV
jgi:hypothetical protein